MWSVSNWYSSLFWFFSFFDWNLLNATRPLYSFEHFLKFVKSKDLQVLQVINVVYYELYFWWLFVKQRFFIINQIDTWSFHLNNSFSTRSDQKSVRPRATTLIIPQDNVERWIFQTLRHVGVVTIATQFHSILKGFPFCLSGTNNFGCGKITQSPK